MSPWVHSVTPAGLETQYKLNLQALIQSESIRRLWHKDLSLWPISDQIPISLHYLDWLDLPQNLELLLNRLSACLSPGTLDGFDHVVFIGMNAASFAADLVASLSLQAPGFKILLLDSVAPESIRAVEAEINLARTLFLAVTKQTSSLRVCLLLLYFLKRYKDAGISNSGRHFVAFAEENSYVAQLARQYAFREVFVDSPGLLGQFSGIVHYGVLFAALGMFTPSALSAETQRMAQLCSPEVASAENPALNLAALLSAAAQSSGRLLFFASPRVAPLASRLGHVACVATCRNGLGLVAAFFAGAPFAS